MATKIRSASADEPIAKMIDEAHNSDEESKNAKNKCDALKVKISDVATKQMETVEKSLRLCGSRSTALVTRKESMKMDLDAAAFTVVADAVAKGNLEGVVSKRIVASVAPDKLDEIRRLVGDVVFQNAFSVKTEYSVEPDGYRDFDVGNSPERSELKKALDDCVKVETSFTVKFEANK